MDSSTISAFAAAAAAVAAASVAAIQLYIGVRQSRAELRNAEAAMMSAQSVGRHTIAAFRQKWIETVRDTLSEYHSILMSPNSGIRADDERKLAALKTKLGLLLNPDEDDSQELLVQISELEFSDTDTERLEKDQAISSLAHKILKTEWVRIKSELKERKPK